VADASSAAIRPTGGAIAPTFVDAKSKLIPFYLTNPQASAMNIASITIGGDFYGEFRIFGTQCGATLGPHKTCKISVQYQPVNATTARAEIDVSADLAVAPVPLWGNGVQVRALPDALAFADQAVGTTSAAKTITLTNNQTRYLLIKEVVVTGEFAKAASSTCGAKLGIGKSCTIAVTFTPTGTGARAGTLTIHGGTEISPVSIPLAGNGVE
jgi:hypothetical protein